MSYFISCPLPLLCSDYLQQAYEALLRSNGINIDTLRQCAAASLNPNSNKPDLTSQSSSSQSNNNRDKVVEHDDLPITHTESSYEATEPLNCLDAVAYNIILRPQYMMLVPRSKKDFASAVNINSFGTVKSSIDCVNLSLALSAALLYLLCLQKVI